MQVRRKNYRFLWNASVDTGIVKQLSIISMVGVITAKYMTNTKIEMYDFYLYLYLHTIYNIYVQY